MADILALLQKFKIPESVDKFGGLKFDETGKIISAQMSLFIGEPSETYKDFMLNIFKVKLQEADNNPVMQGWRDNGVRAKIDKFLDSRLGEILKEYENAQKVLIHGDFTTYNLLFDAETLQVTALLDFDFSYVATAADEFMGHSLGNIPGGKLPGPFDSESDLNLRNGMLTGFSKSLPIAGNVEAEWDIAKVWDDALARAGMAKPSTIPQFEEITDIYWFQDKLSPFELDNPFMRKRKSAEQLQAIRNETESLILRFLESKSIPSVSRPSQ